VRAAARAAGVRVLGGLLACLVIVAGASGGSLPRAVAVGLLVGVAYALGAAALERVGGP